MRLVAAFRQALFCLCLIHSFTTVATHHARRQETTAAADSPGILPSTSASALTDDGQTHTTPQTSSAGLKVTSTTLPSTIPPASSVSIPTPTQDTNPTLFNATFPDDQLPLEPQVTPGWAVSGTILTITGIIYALVGVRGKRLQTFFSTAFLAALGTTVLILYLMTPPVSHAVQGAFVIAAVCTGAALGGLALLFRDLTECLGCALGGFCLSMWLLTLRPGGLVGPDQSTGGKIVFIAAFTCAGLCLYFSRWTRTHGLVAGISFAGSTAAILGIDCFSRAGLREFWAYIWAVNGALFPEGVDSYPLTRGIRVELALTVILSIVGGISQLKLWRVVRDRRNQSMDVAGDEEVAVRPDEEEGVERRVRAMAAQERREWERAYGDGESGRGGGSDSAVGDMESEKPEEHSKKASAASAVEVWSPIETPDRERPAELANESPLAHGIIEKNVGDGRMSVGVFEYDMSEGDTVDRSAQGKAHNASHDMPSAPATDRSLESGQTPPIVPLPFKIPPPRSQEDESSVAAVAEDEFLVVAVADDNDEPTVLAPDDGTASVPRMWRNSVSIQRNQPRLSAESEADGNAAPEESIDLARPIKVTGDDLDSVIAILDDESTSVHANSASLDWRPTPEESVIPSIEEEQQQGVGTDQEGKLPDASADDVRENEAGSPAAEKPARQSMTSPPQTETGETMEKQEEAATARDGTPADTIDGLTLSASESGKSARKTIAGLTKINLPPALPDVALTYRTNEWAKHLSIAERPEPEELQISHHTTEASEEQPARLDIVELQQTAVDGTPPPAAARTSSAMLNQPPHRVLSAPRATPSASDIGAFTWSVAPDLQSGSRPAGYRSTSTILARQNSLVPQEPIAEEDGETRRIPRAQRAEAIQPAQPTTNNRHSASHSISDHAIQPSGGYAHAKAKTLIGMREMLLRSRASGIFTPINNISRTRTHPPPSQPTSQPSPSSKLDADLDDLPLSQRRSLIRQSQSQSSLHLQLAQQQPTAEFTTFSDSHQPIRQLHSTTTVPSRESVRQAQLAQLLSSVAADLRAAAAPSSTHPRNLNRASSSGTTTLLPLNNELGLNRSTSLGSPQSAFTSTMNSGIAHIRSSGDSFGSGMVPSPAAGAGMAVVVYSHSDGGAEPEQQKGDDALRSIELQRRILLAQKEAEARRREVEATEKLQYQREFEERMRNGVLMGAHRNAMRRLQGSVKN